MSARRVSIVVGALVMIAGCGAPAPDDDDDDDAGSDACSGPCVCQPGTATCEAGVSHVCLPDGSGRVDVVCDPVQGMSCGATGLCEGACAPAELAASYVGCD